MTDNIIISISDEGIIRVGDKIVLTLQKELQHKISFNALVLDDKKGVLIDDVVVRIKE